MTLEQRVADALKAKITSADLATLIGEVEVAAAVADTAVDQARVRAFDPAVIDPAARGAMQDFEFIATRHRSALPQLHNRLKQVQADEYLAQWRADFEAVKVKRDAMADELRRVYPALVEQLADLLRRCAANDEEVYRLHNARPTGVRDYLQTAEMTARGIDAFHPVDCPSIATALKLPDFGRNNKMLWPKPEPQWQPPMVPAGPVITGENWPQMLEERNRRQLEDSERIFHRREQDRAERAERERLERERTRDQMMTT